jgi:hypothetical protein
MDLFDLTPEQRNVLVTACDAQGLDTSYASFLAQHIDAADSSWRTCCHSSCDPCVETLGRAVDHARRKLCIQPEGLPETRPEA